MFFEGKPIGTDPEREAAIVAHFRPADRLLPRDPQAFNVPLFNYLRTFGAVDFSSLEMLFRRNELQTHFLAVPSELVKQEDPTVTVADINDVFFYGFVHPRHFAVRAVSGVAALWNAIADPRMQYESTRSNLLNLQAAGVTGDTAHLQRIERLVSRAPFN